MKPDIAAAIATPAEAQWVEAELVRSLMRTARNTQLIGYLLIPIFVGVLWNSAPPGALLLWSLVALAVASARFWIIRKYVREVMAGGRRSIWRSSSAIASCGPSARWSGACRPCCIFDRSPLADQFICWLIMAGLAMFSINSLSSHLRTLRAYLDTLALTALARHAVARRRGAAVPAALPTTTGSWCCW